jgi:soluble lytic murein transglycosylase
MRSLGLLFAISAGVAVSYCAAQREPGKRAASVAPPRASVAEKTPALADAGAAPTELGEERYAPLLLRPGFEEVVRALDDGDVGRAADLVADRLVKAPPSAAEVPSFSYLSALLFERAGRSAEALAAYERANRPDYSLVDYARVGRARSLLALGRAEEALAGVRLVSDTPALARARRALLGDAAFRAGRRDEALTAWRTAIADAPTAQERWAVSTKLAAALLGLPPSDAPSQADAGAPVVSTTTDAALEALRLARRVAAEGAGSDEVSRRAKELEGSALSALPADEQKRQALPSTADEVTRVKALVEARRFDEALAAVAPLHARLEPSERTGELGCELALARAKAEAGVRRFDKARGATGEALASCAADADRHARALFLAGKYAVSERSFLPAAQAFQKLETEHPKSSLADDARLQAALAYRELGVTARFTELLSSMPDDYPDGDMTVEGLFRLAVERVDRGDWSGAASVLERATRALGDRDAERGPELAGRERYFAARADLALGRREPGLAGLERVVREAPFSYYMLHAYSRLVVLDAERAKRAKSAGFASSEGSKRPAVPRTVLEEAGYLRALELLRVGDTPAAAVELDGAGLARPGAGPELLWAAARVYERAGALKLAHDIARTRLTDWLSRWPAADWADAWRVAFPRPYRELVERQAQTQKLASSLVFAIMREESAFDPAAESQADAYGLMQLIVPTARVAAKGTSLPHDRRALLRPSVNVELGCRTLARFGRVFSENPLLVVPAYNAGPSRVKQWLDDRPSSDFDLWVESIPYLETRRYTKRVLASRAAYAFLYAPENSEESMLLPERIKP